MWVTRFWKPSIEQLKRNDKANIADEAEAPASITKCIVHQHVGNDGQQVVSNIPASKEPAPAGPSQCSITFCKPLHMWVLIGGRWQVQLALRLGHAKLVVRKQAHR